MPQPVTYQSLQFLHDRRPRGKRIYKDDARRIYLDADRRRAENDRVLRDPKAKDRDLWAAALQTLRRENFPEPQSEFMFSDRGNWRFDLAWPEFLIAIEVHGATHARGRHTRGVGFENDRKKMNEAQRLMWRVFEFTSSIGTKEGIAYFIDIMREVFNHDISRP